MWNQVMIEHLHFILMILKNPSRGNQLNGTYIYSMKKLNTYLTFIPFWGLYYENKYGNPSLAKLMYHYLITATLIWLIILYFIIDYVNTIKVL